MSQSWAFLFWMTAIAAIPLGSFLAIVFSLTGLNRPDGYRDGLAISGLLMGTSVVLAALVVVSGGFLNG
jgi:hypothetical protein